VEQYLHTLPSAFILINQAQATLCPLTQETGVQQKDAAALVTCREGP
jgi:hypothetical protein